MPDKERRPRIDIPWTREEVDTARRPQKPGKRQPYEHLATMLAVFVFLPATFAIMRSWQRANPDGDEIGGLYVLGFFAGAISLIAVILRAVCKDRYFGEGWHTEGPLTRSQFAMLTVVETFCLAFQVFLLSYGLWLLVSIFKPLLARA